MYESTDTNLPLYSVSPHFRRTTISEPTLGLQSVMAQKVFVRGSIQLLQHRPRVFGLNLCASVSEEYQWGGRCLTAAMMRYCAAKLKLANNL